MGEHAAFFYGTLMSPQILHRVCRLEPSTATHLHTTPALLHDHSRRHVTYADYPGMIPHKGSSVRGTYVAGLTEENMDRLDLFEGSAYVKRKVMVKLLPKDKKGGKKNEAEGELVEATTYMFLDPEDLEEKEWNYEEFVKDKLSDWVGKSTTDQYADLEDDVADEKELSSEEKKKILESAV